MGKTTIAKKKVSFQDGIDITSQLAISPGWVCPGDGIITINVEGNAAECGYYITDRETGNDIVSIYDNARNNSTSCTISGIVLKGHTYYQRWFSGRSQWAKYYAF